MSIRESFNSSSIDVAGISNRLQQITSIVIPGGIFLLGLWLVVAPIWLIGWDQSWRGAGLAIILVGLFAAGVRDQIAAVMFFGTSTAIAALPAGVAFSGFLSQGTWIVFAGFVLAAAIKNTGLSRRLARTMLPSRPGSYAAAVFSLSALALAMALMLPSTAARVLLLAPIAVSYAEMLGYESKSRETLGLVIGSITTTYFCGGGILTAALTNVAMVSLAKETLGVEITYQEYLASSFPILSLMTFVLLNGLVAACFGRRAPNSDCIADASTASSKPNGDQTALLVIIAATVLMWATDGIHHIPVAWTALAAAGLVLSGPGRKLVLADCVKIDVWIIFAALLSLGAILDHTSATDRFGNWLAAQISFEPGNDWRNLAYLTAVGSILSLVGTNLAAPVLYTAIAEPLANATGWPIKTVLLVGVPSWTLVPFVFQTPILLVSMKMLGLSVRALGVFMLGFSIVGMAILVPVNFLWLGYLGYVDVAGVPSDAGTAAKTARPIPKKGSGVPLAASGGVDRNLSSIRQSGPYGKLPAIYMGWLYWRCWDEAQQIVVRVNNEIATVGTEQINARGMESYLVQDAFRHTPVEIEIDPAGGTFTMRETQADQAIGVYAGRISPDLRLIETRPGGCEPELTLRADEDRFAKSFPTLALESK